MLKGTEFGRAIGEAIQRKLDAGAVSSKAEIARHFGVKPPSLSDWVRKGSVAKDKLPELWRFFSDVAGPEHWGLSPSEWPTGLSGETSSALLADENVIVTDSHDEARLILMYRGIPRAHQKYVMESFGMLFSLFSELAPRAKEVILNRGRDDENVAMFAKSKRTHKTIGEPMK